MLQISRRADYAVRIMLELGLQEKNYPMCSNELSRRTQVTKSFLHKIVADLVKAGLVRTYRGPSGGLVLGRPTQTINMRHILEAIDGPICLNECLLSPQECPRDAGCPAHRFWGRAQTVLIEEFEKATLDTLVAESRELAHRPLRLGIPYVYPVRES